MLFIDQFAYANNMRNSHPIEKFVFAIFTMSIALAVDKHEINIFIIAIMLGLLIFQAKIPGFVVGKLLLIPLGFLTISVITIVISISSNNLEMLISIEIGSYFLGVTSNSLYIASKTFLKAFSSLTCLYFLVLTTPMIEFIYVLEKLKFPKIIIELMMLIYRFIFIFLETAFKIYIAQSSRWGYSSFRKSISSFGILFANLWGKAYLKSQCLYTSLIARGYDNQLKVLNPSYTFSKNSILLFVIIDLAILVIAFI